MKIVFLFLLALTIASCSEKDKSSSSGGSSNGINGASAVQVQLDSDEVSLLSLAKAKSVGCSLNIGGATHNGDCMTPISLKAKVFRINLSNSFGGPPARLLDFSASPEGNPTGGPHGLLGLTTYDIASAAQNTNPYSDDNLQDSQNNYFNSVTMEMGAMELKLEIPSGNAGVTNKFWTIRYMLLPQNPLDISAINSCVTDSTIRTHLTSTGDLYPAPSGFSQGDILLCKKATTGAVCADSDFEWIDSTNGAASGTRPGSPVILSGAQILQDNSCSQGGGNLSMGGSKFKANLVPAVSMTKGRESNNCMFKYSFQTNCTTTGLETGSCSDSVQSGFGIDVSVDFDLSNSLFVETAVDLVNDTEVSIQQNLNLILPKPLYVEDNKVTVGTGDDTGLDAQVTIAVNNTVASNALTAKGEDLSKYDSDFCFIPQETGGN